jgi:flagellar biosynthesis protein FlhA
MIFRGEPFAAAIQTYAALTIGDGLLSQLPALFVSIATGLIVTRSV